MTLSEAVAKNLNRIREERGLSVQEVAKLAGLSRMTVYRYESGEGGLDLGTISKFAAIFGVEETALTSEPEKWPESPKETANAVLGLIQEIPELIGTSKKSKLLRKILAKARGLDEFKMSALLDTAEAFGEEDSLVIERITGHSKLLKRKR